ncbi:MAG TPA: YCF48-related protein [Bryobacteraceae bacterium]|nr:YCF48-related protein [Bryobacteraceae bacterium]
MRSALPAVLALILPLAHAQEHWKIQFFYDKPDAVFDIRDLACPTAQRCVGAGAIADQKGHVKSQILTTSDAGQHWTMQDFSEEPVSLFFLNENSGWMVTDHGIWASDEGGRSWKKLDGLKGIVQVYFLDPTHGFAIGYPKAIYETTDGGKKWLKVPAAQLPTGKAEDIVYDCIAFHGQQGAIYGRVITERSRRYRLWLTPNPERVGKQTASELFLLETYDGGKNWKLSTNAIVGQITELRFTNDDGALALVEYHDMYALPSAVLEVKPGSQRAQTVFGERDRAVTDIALAPDGEAFIAAVEPPGNTNQVPIPGKLKVLRSTNLRVWEETDVDYRASAQRATLAVPDARHAWVATDTGMILALEPRVAPQASSR